jgi:heterodisulfide reductase subunit B
VNCPLCHFMLDAKQRSIEREMGVKIGLPVLYLTQLLGLALGLEPQKLGLERLITPPRSLLQKIIDSEG